MHADPFDESIFFRAHLIRRRALIAFDDLILTKRWSMREKDLADIRLLETLKRAREGGQ